MRSVNLRFLAVLIVCLLAIAGTVHAVHIYQHGKHVQFLRELGLRAEAAGDATAAIGHFKRYVTLVKDDAEALEKLGMLLADQNRLREAPLSLAAALNLIEGQSSPDALERSRRLRRRLVEVSLQAQRWSDAEYHLGALIPKDTSNAAQLQPADAELFEQRAICRMGLGRWNEAASDLLTATRVDPSRLNAYALLAEVYTVRLDGRASSSTASARPAAASASADTPPESDQRAAESANPSQTVDGARLAVEKLNELVTLNPDSARAWLIRGQFRVRRINDERIQLAEAQWRAREAGTAAVDVRPLSREQMLDLAYADARRALELAPQDFDVLLLAMDCAHRYREASNPEIVAAHLAEAQEHARSILALCADEFQRLLAEAQHQAAAAPKQSANGRPNREAAAESDEPKQAQPAGGNGAARNDRVHQVEREVYQRAVPAYNVLADIAIRQGDTVTAVHVLSEGLQRVDFDESLLWNLANLKITQSEQPGEDAEIKRLIAALQRRRESKPLADFLRARQLIAQRKWRSAADELARVRPRLTRWPEAVKEVDLWIGACNMELGRPDLARTAYYRVLNADPLSLPARWGLATALEALGDTEGALQRYQQVAARRSELSDFAAWRDLPVRMARSMVALNLKANADRNDPAWQPVVQYVRGLREQVGPHREGAALLDILEAEICLARKMLPEAEQLLRAAVERDPQSVQLWSALIAIQDRVAATAADPQDRLAKWETAEQTLRDAQQALAGVEQSQQLLLQLALGQHLVLQHGLEAREQLQEMAADALELPANSPDERAARLRLLEGIASLCGLVGDVDTASQLYGRIAADDTENLRARLMLFDLGLRAGKIGQELDAILQEVGSIDREGPLWRYGRAVQIAVTATAENQTAGLGPALELLRSAEQEWEDWGRIPFLRGWIYERMNQPNEAATAYLEAFHDGFRTPKSVAELVIGLYRLGRYTEAGEVLMALSETQAPKLVELAQAAVAVSRELADQQQGQSLASLALQFAEATARDSDEAAAHLAYGQILLMYGQVEKAEEELMRARELAPADPKNWLAVIATFVQSGQQERIAHTLEEAHQVLGESEFALVAARTAEALGDIQSAISEYQRGLRTVPDSLADASAGQIELLSRAADFFLALPAPLAEQFAETGEQVLWRLRDEGAPLLASLRTARSQPGAAAPPPAAQALEAQLTTVVASARRRLATVLISRSDAASLQRALDVVRENRAAGRPAPDDRRVEALALSRSPKREQRMQAITILGELVGPTTPSPRDGDRLLLATLHLSEYQRDMRNVALRQLVYGKSAAAALEDAAIRHLNAARDHARDVVLAGPRAVRLPGRPQAETPQANYIGALTAYIEILVLNKEIAEAQFYLAKLKQVAPDSATTRYSEAKVRYALGEFAEVTRLLSQFADTGPEDDHPARLAAIAQLLEGFGNQANGDKNAAAAEQFFSEAEQLLRQLAELNADNQLTLAAFEARRGHTTEALDLIEAHQAAAKPADVANACAHVMGKLGRNREPLDRLEQVLTAALQQHPDSLPLKLMLADLSAWRGNATAAEALYREVLAGAATHAIAANNLAYLLASQNRSLDEALTWIEVAIRQRGELPDLLDTRAFVRLQRGEVHAALSDLSTAVSELPRPAFLFHTAQAYWAAGQKREALDAWKLAVAAGLNEDGLHPTEREAFSAFRAQVQTR